MKRKRRKKLEGALGTGVIVGSQKMFRMMSATRAEKVGAFLFKTVGRFLKKRRQRILDNLEIAFPEWSQAERERVMWANFEHFGRTMADFFRNHDRTLEEISGLTSLTYLSLTSTKITDAGLKHLAGMKKMRFLSLSATGATRAGVDELRKSMPDLVPGTARTDN